MYNKLICRLFLLGSIALLCSSVARADYEAGRAAWTAGRPAEAVAQWQAAAKTEDARAMLALGRVYVKGLGTPQDYVEAHKWLNLAAARGNAEAATERDALAAKMTTEEQAEARRLARAWRSGGRVEPPKSAAVPNAAAPSAPTGPPPPRAIREAQGLMSALGYDPGPADGRWGPRTGSAYAAFLRDADLPHAGMLTPDDLRAMRAAAKRRNVAATEGSPPQTSATPRKPAPPPVGLHRLVAAGDVDGLKAELAAGADANARDGKGWTALMHAVDKGHTLLVPLLLKAGADPNLRLADGATALFVAAVHGHSEIIAALVKAGADPSISGPRGKTALDLALAQGNKEILELPEMAALLDERKRKEHREQLRRQREHKAQQASKESAAFSRAQSLGTPEAFEEYISKWCPAARTCEEAAAGLDESIRTTISGKTFSGTNSLGDRQAFRFFPSGEFHGAVRIASWMQSGCSGSWSVENANIKMRCKWTWPTGWIDLPSKLNGKNLVGRAVDRGTVITWRLPEDSIGHFVWRPENTDSASEGDEHSYTTGD